MFVVLVDAALERLDVDGRLGGEVLLRATRPQTAHAAGSEDQELPRAAPAHRIVVTQSRSGGGGAGTSSGGSGGCSASSGGSTSWSSASRPAVWPQLPILTCHPPFL